MKFFILLTLLILTRIGFSQQTPEFSFQLYFEDAVGNKDTVTLGYDALATDTIDTSFGEVNILNKPWSDSLDVRIGDMTYENYGQLTWLTPNTYLSKHQILNGYCNKDFYSGRVSIQFYTENYPLTIKWAKTLFDTDTCKKNSLFYGEKYWIDVDALDGTILYGSDSITIQPYSEQNVSEQLAVVFKSFSNNNWLYDYGLASYMTGTKEIGVLQFLFYKSNYLSINEIDKNSSSIYPNPTKDFVTVDLFDGWNNDTYELNIFQLDGTFIRKQTLTSSSNTVSVNDLKAGVYFFNIRNNAGTAITKKVIKE